MTTTADNDLDKDRRDPKSTHLQPICGGWVLLQPTGGPMPEPPRNTRNDPGDQERDAQFGPWME